jgi:hypothetical protein
VVQALPAYLFLQGMRGAWTCFYLTHPRYPTIPQQPGAGVSTPESVTDEPRDRQ